MLVALPGATARVLTASAQTCMMISSNLLLHIVHSKLPWQQYLEAYFVACLWQWQGCYVPPLFWVPKHKAHFVRCDWLVDGPLHMRNLCKWANRDECCKRIILLRPLLCKVGSPDSVKCVEVRDSRRAKLCLRASCLDECAQHISSEWAVGPQAAQYFRLLKWTQNIAKFFQHRQTVSEPFPTSGHVGCCLVDSPMDDTLLPDEVLLSAARQTGSLSAALVQDVRQLLEKKKAAGSSSNSSIAGTPPAAAPSSNDNNRCSNTQADDSSNVTDGYLCV